MTQRLANKLKNRARSWAGQLTSLARSLAPAHVQPAIHSKVEEKGDGQFIIRIMADRRVAPDARAQEFGSGLHARRGAKKKYPIQGHPFLVFPWDVATQNPDQFTMHEGKVVLAQVMHPGIEAANGGKGYIAPAMNELRKHARAELSKDIKEAIVGDLRESFGRKAR